MTKFTDRNFSTGSVDLDGNEFEGCRFGEVTLNYGGGYVDFRNCQFGNVAWNFNGALGNGLTMLSYLYGAFGRTEALVDMLSDLVRRQAAVTGEPG